MRHKTWPGSLFVLLLATSCNSGVQSDLWFAVVGESSGVFEGKLSNITCMFNRPNTIVEERHIAVTITPKDHPDIFAITANIRPMPDEVYGMRGLRTAPNLATYLHHEDYSEDIEMHVEVSLGERTTLGGVTEREVVLHNLVIPKQTVGVPDSDRTFDLEGRLSDVRLWCTTDET